jgi:hypothetical protein
MMRNLKHPIVVFVVAVLVVIGAGIAVLVATGTSGLRTTTTVACVPEQSDLIPVSARWDRVSTSGAVHLKRGMFVGLEVVEGEPVATVGSPRVVFSFPWRTPILSSDVVLRASEVCGHPVSVTTVPLAVYWFQAVATGKVTVTVPLTKAWTQATNKSLVPRLQPLRVLVTVR